MRIHTLTEFRRELIKIGTKCWLESSDLSARIPIGRIDAKRVMSDNWTHIDGQASDGRFVNDAGKELWILMEGSQIIIKPREI